MKNIWITILATAGGMLLTYLAIRLFSKSSSNEKDSGCTKVNRDWFDNPWKDYAIPHGSLGDLAKEYLTEEDGAIVGGFFKGINVYPSSVSAKFYQDDLKKYAQAIGLPYWNMSVGSLACAN